MTDYTLMDLALDLLTGLGLVTVFAGVMFLGACVVAKFLQGSRNR